MKLISPPPTEGEEVFGYDVASVVSYASVVNKPNPNSLAGG